MRAPAALVALMAAAAASAQAPPKPRLTPQAVVDVSGPDAQRPVEVTVAISRADLEHVVAIATEAGRPGEPRSVNYAYVSKDGGLTWRASPLPALGRRRLGDNALAAGGDGVFVDAFIAFDGIRVARPERAVTGVWLTRSRDGAAWDDPVPVVDHVNSVAPFEDKPWPAVDNGAQSPHRGNVYVAWTRFDVYGSKDPKDRSHILFARSRDGGKSFEPPLRLSDVSGDAQDGDGTVEGAVPAVGPKGEVYVVWAGPKGILLDRSTDGGFTFGEDRLVSEMPGGWDIPLPGMTRHNGMPVTTVDHSSGKDRGSIYVTWIDERSGAGDTDVWLSASRDGGDAWSAPLRVNDDPKAKAQMFHWTAVDPADGSVNVLFYDRRGLDGTLTGLTLARSVDGGRSFVNHRIAQEPFATNDRVFFGDYCGVDARAGRVVAVYPFFKNEETPALRAAVFRFKPGTQEAREIAMPRRDK